MLLININKKICYELILIKNMLLINIDKKIYYELILINKYVIN